MDKKKKRLFKAASAFCLLATTCSLLLGAVPLSLRQLLLSVLEEPGNTAGYIGMPDCQEPQHVCCPALPWQCPVL